MAERDANLPQLDFPQLVADIIRQLNLTGTVGLLDFLDAVRPVYIVAAREGALSVTASAPVFTSAGITNARASDPLVNEIIGDTGPLPAGNYDIFASMTMAMSATGVGTIRLQHRNAANDTTLAVLLHLTNRTVNDTTDAALPLIGYSVGLNERFRFQAILGGATGQLATVIGFQIRPTP